MTHMLCAACELPWEFAPFVRDANFRCPRCGLPAAETSPTTNHFTSIDSLLRYRGVFPCDNAIVVILKALNVLKQAHEAGLIHGHLRPKRVHLKKDGSVELLVVAPPLRAKGRHSTEANWAANSELQQLFNPIEYIAPELLVGQASIDGRIDIYAVGALLYQMVAGRTPNVAGNSMAEKLANIVNGKIVIEEISNVPKEMITICARALAGQANERFQNINELRQELQLLSSNR